MSSRPLVLVIDDRSDEERLRDQVWGEAIKVSVEHPQDVTEFQLLRSSLVLVDYRLETWPERDNASCLGLRPPNGLALAAVLREYVQRDQSQAVAFAVHSAHLPDLTAGLPAEPRQHLIAKAHNLEWVFAKAKTRDESIVLAGQVASLAAGVQQLPISWNADEPAGRWSIATSLLAVPSEALWADEAIAGVQDCHPPVHEISERSHGLSFLRWLIQRILPYPCFLWDTHYVSARLRVTHDSLSQVLASSTRLTEMLELCTYRGILHGFSGPRWWRAGIEALLWSVTEGNPFELEVLHSTLQLLSGNRLQFSEQIQPVVCLDRDYRPLPEQVGIDDAVRIQPDDWPSYADQAWTTIGLARDEPSLNSLVVNEDRDRVR